MIITIVCNRERGWNIDIYTTLTGRVRCVTQADVAGFEGILWLCHKKLHLTQLGVQLLEGSPLSFLKRALEFGSLVGSKMPTLPAVFAPAQHSMPLLNQYHYSPVLAN